MISPAPRPGPRAWARGGEAEEGAAPRGREAPPGAPPLLPREPPPRGGRRRPRDRPRGPRRGRGRGRGHTASRPRRGGARGGKRARGAVARTTTAAAAPGPCRRPARSDKPLCRGLTFNRSQRGSCSATYETPTQKQVVYEWFSTRRPTNVRCVTGEGAAAFPAAPRVPGRRALRTGPRSRRVQWLGLHFFTAKGPGSIPG